MLSTEDMTWWRAIRSININLISNSFMFHRIKRELRICSKEENGESMWKYVVVSLYCDVKVCHRCVWPLDHVFVCMCIFKVFQRINSNNNLQPQQNVLLWFSVSREGAAFGANCKIVHHSLVTTYFTLLSSSLQWSKRCFLKKSHCYC